MLKINFKTGTAWVRSIVVKGSLKDDLLALIENYIESNPNGLPVYSTQELFTAYSEDYIEENYLPINGGEFYIDAIEFVEEL